jgi:hypothetical protein
MSASHARDEDGGWHAAVRPISFRTIHDSHGQEPAEGIPVAIAARNPLVSVDSQMDTASSLEQFLCDLCSGSAAADDEHSACGRLIGVAVATGMDLDDVWWQLGRQRWNQRFLEWTRCHHD